MKQRAIIYICLFSLAASFCKTASAHEMRMHGKTAASDAQMQGQHDIMRILSIASTRLRAALEKGDSAAVKAETGIILEAVPDLRKARPHKHTKQRKRFVGLVADLQTSANAIAAFATKGDFIGAMEAFKKLEKTCNSCHAEFRD